MKLLTTPRQIKAISSLSESEFNDLAKEFDKAWHKAEKTRPIIRTGQPRTVTRQNSWPHFMSGNLAAVPKKMSD